ncbi:hypothetical protein BDR26DRAFT_361084 [Obelidium mucronatum]|nr:hypothetical protein BDR26DRAFT_361084 [Obelidium mucronatum]
MTQYTWDCDALGNPQGPPVLTDTDEGDGTVANPGHNNTLYNGPGGQAGSNLDYSNKTFQAFTNVYLWTGALFKSSYHISYNPVTKEQITFGNDWTMSFLAIKLTEILAKIPVPMFATILEVSSGTVVATSSDAKIISDDKKRVFSLFEIRDPFMQDFAGYINSMYPPLNNPPLQLGQIASRLAQMPKKSMDLHPRIYVDRVLNGTNWKIEMNTVRFGGGDYLFVTYLNVDAVEADVIQMSLQTGYMMLGIIIAFLMLGTLFATIVSRQLNLVARQIDLLKQLKFGEVLDKDSGIKGRSFVYELAALQESFHEMVTVFAQTIKKSSGLRTGQSSFGLNNGGGNSIESVKLRKRISTRNES